MVQQALAGICILDLTSVVVGPSCTLRLADHGAEVIKLEAPEGDVLRTLGGPSPSGQHSGKYLAFNRNKRAICLDLKQPAARTIRPTIPRDGVPADPGHPARPIGYDTRAVLGEAGYNAAEIDALIASGAARASS